MNSGTKTDNKKEITEEVAKTVEDEKINTSDNEEDTLTFHSTLQKSEPLGADLIPFEKHDQLVEDVGNIARR